MKRAILALLACTGCDALFGLDRVALVDGGSGDGSTCVGDEDCDGTLNADDFCPADADERGEDDDDDGVGNACDPDRLVTGNHIALFDPFDTNANAWSIKSGQWERRNGAFNLVAPGDSRVELAVNVTTPSVEAIIPTYTLVGNGNVHIFGAMTGSELKCSVAMGATGEVLQMDAFLVHKEIDLPGTGVLRIQGGQLQDGTFYCHARHGANFDVELTSGGPVGQAIDKIGIGTSQSSAIVTSIALYDVP